MDEGCLWKTRFYNLERLVTNDLDTVLLCNHPGCTNVSLHNAGGDTDWAWCEYCQSNGRPATFCETHHSGGSHGVCVQHQLKVSREKMQSLWQDNNRVIGYTNMVGKKRRKIIE